MSKKKLMLGIVMHSAHFNIYLKISQHSERIASFGKIFEETEYKQKRGIVDE